MRPRLLLCSLILSIAPALGITATTALRRAANHDA